MTVECLVHECSIRVLRVQRSLMTLWWVIHFLFSVSCYYLQLVKVGPILINIIINGFPSAQLQKLTGPSLVKKSVKAPSWASSSCINISIWPFRYSYKLCQYHIMSTETSDTYMKRLFIEIKFHKSREITQELVHTQEPSLFTYTRFDPNTFEFFSVKYQMWKHC